MLAVSDWLVVRRDRTEPNASRIDDAERGLPASPVLNEMDDEKKRCLYLSEPRPLAALSDASRTFGDR